MQNENVGEIVTLVFRAIAVAMAVAVIVMSVIRAANVETLVLLMGIGLFGVAVTSLDAKEEA